MTYLKGMPSMESDDQLIGDGTITGRLDYQNVPILHTRLNKQDTIRTRISNVLYRLADWIEEPVWLTDTEFLATSEHINSLHQAQREMDRPNTEPRED